MMSYKAMAYGHFFMSGMCAAAGVTDLVTNQITYITPLILALAALNLWLGIQRLEGK